MKSFLHKALKGPRVWSAALLFLFVVLGSVATTQQAHAFGFMNRFMKIFNFRSSTNVESVMASIRQSNVIFTARIDADPRTRVIDCPAGAECEFDIPAGLDALTFESFGTIPRNVRVCFTGEYRRDGAIVIVDPEDDNRETVENPFRDLILGKQTGPVVKSPGTVCFNHPNQPRNSLHTPVFPLSTGDTSTRFSASNFTNVSAQGVRSVLNTSLPVTVRYEGDLDAKITYTLRTLSTRSK